MSINASLLTSGRVGAQASYVTGIILPGVNDLVLVWVANWISPGIPNVPTLSGNSLTYVQVNTIRSFVRVSLFRALGTPISDSITIDFAGQVQNECCWGVIDVTGIDFSGTNGSGAIVQSVAASGITGGSSFAITLAPFFSGNNATFGGIEQQNSFVLSPGVGFTQLSNNVGSIGLITEWRSDNAVTVDASSTGSDNWDGIAVEIAAAPTAPALIGAAVSPLVWATRTRP